MDKYVVSVYITADKKLSKTVTVTSTNKQTAVEEAYRTIRKQGMTPFGFDFCDIID
jgi:hypothetical protein